MSNSPSPNDDIYLRLGVQKDSSTQTIHKHFLKLLSPLLDKIKASRDSTQLLDELRALWVAHDILVDPDCRTDYDLRSLGIQTSDIDEQDDSQTLTFGVEPGQASKSVSWRIGELLQAVGILEQAELDIACDMHKAMPEMQFGRFLVKQSFLNEAQLQAVLIGQILIRAGELTLSQFMTAMSEVSKTHGDIKEVLLELGYIKNPILFQLEN